MFATLALLTAAALLTTVAAFALGYGAAALVLACVAESWWHRNGVR
jgi:hypothetical protein